MAPEGSTGSGRWLAESLAWAQRDPQYQRQLRVTLGRAGRTRFARREFLFARKPVGARGTGRERGVEVELEPAVQRQVVVRDSCHVDLVISFCVDFPKRVFVEESAGRRFQSAWDLPDGKQAFDVRMLTPTRNALTCSDLVSSRALSPQTPVQR